MEVITNYSISSFPSPNRKKIGVYTAENPIAAPLLSSSPFSSERLCSLGVALLVFPQLIDMERPRCGLVRWVSISRLLFVSCVFLCSVPGSLSSKAVTLGSIQIFNTHEFLSPKPTIYFYCKGEHKTILPDVKEKHFFYTFKGKESWQPLTELTDNKCKRCGLYEMDRIKSDDIFDEWELCLDDFIDGQSIHFKFKEFNATFLCNECRAAADSGSNSSSKSGFVDKKINVVLVIVISAFVSVMAAAATVGAYRYWQKRKREQDQARFLKLFEDGDGIEDELDLE